MVRWVLFFLGVEALLALVNGYIMKGTGAFGLEFLMGNELKRRN